MQDLPYWKAILIALAIIAVAGLYIFFATLLGLNNPWVAFVALTVWGAVGMKLEQAPGIFVGAAIGLLISLSLVVLPELFGDIALILPVGVIVLAIACKIKEVLPLFSNFGLFIFLTIGSADVFMKQRMQLDYLQNLALGAVCFWIIPWLVVRLRTNRAVKE